ncbi:MAG: dihydrolipoyl dehydrogenase [Actinomycetota bacterium]
MNRPAPLPIDRGRPDVDHDIIVIGAGPGGYVAAIRAAQLGFKVACVDRSGALGGTCLNVGCIPSKSLLHTSATFASLNGEALRQVGITAGDAEIDLAAVMAAKDKTVADLNLGVAQLFAKNKVEFITGVAYLAGPHAVEVDGRRLSATRIVIATGSTPSALPGIEFDGTHVVDSTGALRFADVPTHLVVVGAGAIGLELGSVWSRFGAEVTVVEAADRVLPTMDCDLSTDAHKVFRAQGLGIELGASVGAVRRTRRRRNSLDVEIQPHGGEASVLRASHVLVATGRRANTADLRLDALGLGLDDTGRIPVDEHFQTSVPSVYAIGDVIAGPMLAHKAEDEGIAVAEIFAGLPGMVNHEVIPAIVYTRPEIASVGLDETTAAARTSVATGTFRFVANSRAKVAGESDGFVKVVADADTRRVLGVHILGAQAGHMIAQAAQAMEFGASTDDIAYTCHAHPTQAEALKEAAMAVFDRPIHA